MWPQCAETFLLQIAKQSISNYLTALISTQLWTLLECHLCNVFSEQLISRDIWPLKLPDLSPSDFNLWDAMKVSVYEVSPCSLCHLKGAITNFIWSFPHAEFLHVFVNRIKWVNACLQAHGAPLPTLVILSSPWDIFVIL